MQWDPINGLFFTLDGRFFQSYIRFVVSLSTGNQVECVLVCGISGYESRHETSANIDGIVPWCHICTNPSREWDIVVNWERFGNSSPTLIHYFGDIAAGKPMFSECAIGNKRITASASVVELEMGKFGNAQAFEIEVSKSA